MSSARCSSLETRRLRAARLARLRSRARPGEPLVEGFAALLDAGERERAARFRSDERAHQFLAGARAATLGVVVLRYRGSRPRTGVSWRRAWQARARARFTAVGLEFNVSRTRALLVAMAVARGGPGRRRRGMPDCARCAAGAGRTLFHRRVKSPPLAALPRDRTAASFPAGCGRSRKPSSRRSGPGIAGGLGSMTFEFDAAGGVDSSVRRCPSTPRRWQFWQGQPSERAPDGDRRPRSLGATSRSR